MKDFLDGFLPRIIPSNMSFQVISHEGKSDLQKSIPRKLKAWKEPGVEFIILMDQDSGDCLQIKQKLQNLCHEGHRPDTLIRIVCRELESWFMGDLEALDEALGINLKRSENRALKRVPDTVESPSHELERLVPSFQKRATARAIAPLLKVTPQNNRSTSFGYFIEGIARKAGVSS